jgi:hypothetical protein
LKAELLVITVTDTKDKEGYKKLSAAISQLTGLRGEVERTRKTLKEVALVYGRAVDGEAKRITNELLSIEEPLRANKEHIDQAIADEKAAEARRLAERFNARTNSLFTLGFTFNGTSYSIEGLDIPVTTIQHATDEEWSDIIGHATTEAQAVVERKRKEQEERDRLEADRQALADKMAELDRLKAELHAKEEALKPKPAPQPAPQPQTAPWGKTPFDAQRVKDAAILPDGPTDDADATPLAKALSAEYREGYNAACRDVLNILKSPDKFTRDTLRDMIYKLIKA